MGESEYRCWEELLPDALELVFRNLPLQEVLTVVPRVCKSWGRVVAGPYCWQEIDIEEWSQQRQSRPDQLVRMLDLLVRRISVSGLPCDPLFSFIGDHARALRTLEIPRSEISDAVVEAVAPGCPTSRSSTSAAAPRSARARWRRSAATAGPWSSSTCGAAAGAAPAAQRPRPGRRRLLREQLLG
uniref:F-box domain-containing protein n=1 Tax=Aegilops tauschii subsp. strangulata TaxID=200361 RepID=A0A453PMB3_AEGTS